MQILKTKKATVTAVIFLVVAISLSMALLPSANAHTPIWTFASYAYLTVQPSPVGVGQSVHVVMWIDGPLPGATVANDIRRHDYKLTITAPDGSIETKNWPVVEDTTSVQYTQFTPNQVGTYTFKFEYPEQVFTWSGAYNGDIFRAASETTTLEVQQDPIPAAIDTYPLPTEYWMRPIEGQNTYWYSISSHWLGSPYVIGAGAGYGIPGAVQLDGTAPNSAHVMWAKPIQWGGVVGGDETQVPGEMWYSGLSYNTRFSNPIIMNGVLYYPEPYGNGGTGGDFIAVNLQTGEELWRINTTATGVNLVPSFGYLYSYHSPNQHGVLPNGLLVATQNLGGGNTAWRAYDARTGVLTTMNITNIPTGTNVKGPQGEIMRYGLVNLGTSAAPRYNLTIWNSSKVFGAVSGLSPTGWYSGTVNASLPSAFEFRGELTLPKGTWNVGTAGQGAIPLIVPGDKMLLIQGGFGGHPGDFNVQVNPDYGNITAVNLKPGMVGQVLWTANYPNAPGNNSRVITDWDPEAGIFVFEDKESIEHFGYSLTNGQQIWKAEKPIDDTIGWNFMAQCLERIAYGKLYVSGYAGILYCYDVKSGELLWSYGNGGEGNSTKSGFLTPYGRYPIFISTIADNKVYLSTTEHSPNSPLYKDSRFRCVNATDGTEVWTILDYGNQMYGGQAPVADGYLVTLNSYDSRIYSFGKGPSQLTVTAPDLAAASGQPVVIRGTVTDIAAGTKQDEQAARFPNGVPAMSDASMGDWMEYVYMQKPMPMDAVGVQISIDVLDANGNYRNIGTATSDAYGVYSLTWTPDIEGTFTAFATFAGSNSFYPAHAETSFAVMPPAPTPTEAPAEPASTPVEMYFVGSTIAIIIAIVVIGALIMMMMKRRPS